MACRQTGAQRQSMNANMLRDNEGIILDIDCVGSAFESIEGRRNVLGPPNLQDDRIEAQVSGE